MCLGLESVSQTSVNGLFVTMNKVTKFNWNQINVCKYKLPGIPTALKATEYFVECWNAAKILLLNLRWQIPKAIRCHTRWESCTPKLFQSWNTIRSKVIETFSNLNKGLISRKPQNFIKYIAMGGQLCFLLLSTFSYFQIYYAEKITWIFIDDT